MAGDIVLPHQLQSCAPPTSVCFSFAASACAPCKANREPGETDPVKAM